MTFRHWWLRSAATVLRAHEPDAQRRLFSTSTASLANRAIVYSAPGNPAEVLTALTYPSLPDPPSNAVNIRYLLSPINPSDINVVEGVYPSKPTARTNLSPSGLGSQAAPVIVAGNEGLAEVTAVGDGVSTLKTGDWVIMTKQQTGTWGTCNQVGLADLVKVPHGETGQLSEVHGATMTVNPPTALNVLQEFIELEENDWVVQNGANSAVGQAIVQIAAHRGLKTINFIRNRDDLDSIKKHLTALGATHVFTYDDLEDKAFRGKMRDWTGGKDIRLGLNCVSGKPTARMAGLLGQDAHLVSYGAMSKEPLSLSTSLFIFKNLTCHGYWQSRWYKERSNEEREGMMQRLAELMVNGKLREPEHEIVTFRGTESDEQVTKKLRNYITKTSKGKFGKKILLKFDEVQE